MIVDLYHITFSASNRVLRVTGTLYSSTRVLQYGVVSNINLVASHVAEMVRVNQDRLHDRSVGFSTRTPLVLFTPVSKRIRKISQHSKRVV